MSKKEGTCDDVRGQRRSPKKETFRGEIGSAKEIKASYALRKGGKQRSERKSRVQREPRNSLLYMVGTQSPMLGGRSLLKGRLIPK